MPQFLPFRGLRYTTGAGRLDDLLAPPYDVISAAQQQALEARSPYNAVHLELASGGEERYGRVAELLRSWEAGGAMERDGEPMLYVYEQVFELHGQAYRRRAMLAAVEAQPWEEGAVKPHEFTMSGPKEDRLKLLEATRVQFSPVFMIARDRAGQLCGFIDETIASRGPDVTGTSADGETHRLWVVPAGRYEMRQVAPLLAESFYIADGHHRYETAVNYRDARIAERPALERDHPARFAMSAIVPMSDPGLIIRAIHRVVPKAAPADWEARLAERFSIEPVAGGGDHEARAEELLRVLESRPSSIVAINLVPGATHILTPRDESVFEALAPAGHSADWVRTPPNLLRYGVLTPLWEITDDDLRLGVVEYEHDAPVALERAAAGEVAFLLNPVTVQQVLDLADKNERMPQKSTFFHPKLGTGLVMHPLEP